MFIRNLICRDAANEGGTGGGSAAGGSGGSAGGAPAPITSAALGAVQGDAFRALLPEEIRSKPYVREINNFGDLVKKLDGSQSLLGQRATPAEDAPADVWKDFHSKVAPKSPDGYKFPAAVEGVDPKLVESLGKSKVLGPLLHAAQLSPYQASVLVPGFLKIISQAEVAEKTERDTAFTKLAGDLFGEQKDTIMTNAKKYLATHVDEKVRPLLESLDEKQMTVVLAITDGMAKKFTGEDPFRGGAAGSPGAGGDTEASVVAAMQEIMKDPCYSDPFKDRPKHRQLSEKMEGLRGRLKKIKSGG